MLIISFALMAFVIAVDQVTKHAVLSVIGIGGRPVIVVDRFFYIVCHRNSGAAWGILKDGRVFFLIITPLMLAAMLVFLIRNKSVLLRLALSFVIGGAAGNFIDRLIVGSVVDFLDFYIFGYNFPTFNAADSSIVLGAALMIVFTFRMEKKKAAAVSSVDVPVDGSDDESDVENIVASDDMPEDISVDVSADGSDDVSDEGTGDGTDI
ncbi:MAG: signal peptidase II [Oscillospiraceae bacterium]|nr:signal peptidase II [Oscillospiraceae bacterium]